MRDAIPTSELKVVQTQAKTAAAQPKVPPPNPHYRDNPQADHYGDEGDTPPKSGLAEAKQTLDEGTVLVRWPDDLSEDSFYEFEYFLKGVIARARRKAGVGRDNKSNPNKPPSEE